MSPEKPKKVYCIRVDESDIRAAKRLRIQLGPALRRYIKVLISRQLTIANKKKESTEWKIKEKQS